VSRGTVYRLVFLAAGCLAGLLIAEAFVRVSNVWIGRHSDMMFTVMDYDELLGWKMRPGVREEIDIVDVEGLPVRANSEGFFDDEFPTDEPSGVCRIAFLGDSMVWGYVPEEERFTELVAASQPTWQSLNFGIGGYGTDQSLLVWRQLARRFRPDTVVLTINPNDYNDNMSAVIWGRRKPYFELRDDGELVLANTPVDPKVFWDDGIFHQAAPPYAELMQGNLMKRSRLSHWLAKNSDLVRALYTTARELQGPVAPPVPRQRHEALSPLEVAQVRLLRALVHELARDVRASGARFGVVFSGEWNPRYERQRADFEAAGIPYLDATASMEDAGRDGVPVRETENGHLAAGIYYPYSLHWNSAGHRAVAELVEGFIRSAELCPHGT
jgi:lysophospholipase L1-like esterase